MYQNIILIGNLGRDPEMRYTTAGKAFTSFSLATTEMIWKPEGEGEPSTTWWNVTCWGKTAERVHEKAHKGSRVLVEGRIKPGENGTPNIFIRKDNTPGASYDLTASVVRVLDKKVDPDYYKHDAEIREYLSEYKVCIDQLTAHDATERQDDKWIPEVQE